MSQAGVQEAKKISPELNDASVPNQAQQVSEKGAEAVAETVVPSANALPATATTVQVPKMADQILNNVRHNNQLLGYDFVSGGATEPNKELTQEQLAVQSVQNDLNQWLDKDGGKAWLASDAGKTWKETYNNGQERIVASGQFDAATEELVRGFQRSQLEQGNPGWYSGVDGVVGPRTMRQLDIALGRPTLDEPTFQHGLDNGVYASRTPNYDLGFSDEPAWVRGRGGRMERNPEYQGRKKKSFLDKLPELSGDFLDRTNQIAEGLKIPGKWLMAVMSFETGGTFAADVKNGAGSGATGLIQFMKSTAQDLGTTTGELARMTPEDQLAYVQKYLHKQMNAVGLSKINSLEDLYMLVLHPRSAGKGSDYEMFSAGTKVYAQNSGLDVNGNGVITPGEAAAKVREHLASVEEKYGDRLIG